MATTVGIISDTHGMLRPEVLERLAACDVILHGGDINKKEILDKLGQIAPLYAVRGNNDKDWAEYLPHSLQVQIEELKFFMVHNKKDVPKKMEGIEDVDVIVFGHSHKYLEQTLDGRLWLNPGSCGRRRFDQEITFAMMKVDGKEYQVKKIIIPHS